MHQTTTSTLARAPWTERRGVAKGEAQAEISTQCASDGLDVGQTDLLPVIVVEAVSSHNRPIG
jgi:ERCC4-related helicase